jgi:uncharacterized protein YbjQ (UPF0145 family)
MSSFSEEYRKDREDRSRKQIEAGGLPLDAEWRLKRLNDNPRLFTGNLSVNELALSVSVGIQPLGQVLGASTYKVGWQYVVPYYSQELTVLTEAHAAARFLAISRMRQEAVLIGADGVVGVRLERRMSENQPGLLDYHAFGTAVRLDGPERWKNPFIAAVTVQEMWALLRSGHFPIGFVFGGCVYYQVAGVSTQWIQRSNTPWSPGGYMTGPGPGWRNVEMTEYSQAVYHARRRAMEKIEYEANTIGADGVVGMQVETSLEFKEVEVNEVHRRDAIVHFMAYGTAIMPIGEMPAGVEYVVPVG